MISLLAVKIFGGRSNAGLNGHPFMKLAAQIFLMLKGVGGNGQLH